MTRLLYLSAACVLLTFAADDQQGMPWRTNAIPQPSVFAGQSLPVLPDLNPPPTQNQQPQNSTAATAAPAGVSSAGSAAPPVPKKTYALDPSKPLDPDARMDLIRYIDGEFAKAKQALPQGKDGFTMKVGQPLDNNMLSMSLSRHGAAFSPGDRVQVTRILFRNKEIVLELNGGGKPHSSWRDHVTWGVGQGGDVPAIQTQTTTTGMGGEPVKLGSTLVLEFGKPVPEMTPDELKADLGPVLEFSPRSAATQWIDTLPPEIQKAIAEKRPMLGMTHEMVVAAIGKPDRIVRETAADGTPTEDWIYGTPPAKTVFVTYTGDKVIRIEQFPQ